jgi:hypothetical protein
MNSQSLKLTLLLVLFGTFLQAQHPFFDEADALFNKYVQNGLIDYPGLLEEPAMEKLVKTVASLEVSDWPDAERKAFYINAYNLLVIQGALNYYPIASVKDVAGFFDRKRFVVAGRSLTLNELEKTYLLKKFNDARLHFVLVCGAKGCPPLIPEAYFPDQLEEQLDRQTRAALNNATFLPINEEEKTIGFSQIFRWYAADFGGSPQAIRAYINSFREEALPEDYTIDYYTYDWSLNTASTNLKQQVVATNAARYIVSSTIPKGNTETKIFNNLYSERLREPTGMFAQRNTFFTNINSFLYGLNHRVNIGFDLRYRRVLYGTDEDTPFSVFADQTRQGITTFGPKVRIAPVPRWTNFSIQSAFWFATGDNLAGRQGGDQRFIDWEGPTWWTQVFNDFPIGTQFTLFTEIDLLGEDLGSAEGRINRWSTPTTIIFSYFPTPMATVYALGNYSPFWQQDFDYFWQLGVGTKYQFTPNFELELSYTYFQNDFLRRQEGRAATYNMGIRFNL